LIFAFLTRTLLIESAGVDADIPEGAISVNNADLSCGKMASV
jgi:hypothetical protein